MLLLSACVNDINAIKKVTFKSTDPDQRTEYLHIFETEDALPKFKLFAPLAESYSKPENITKFKKGVRVDFYTEDGEIETILTGLYGEINQSQGTMRILDSVQLYNPAKEQTMYTEALYWNQKDSLIFTDKMVMIKSPKELLYGKGIRAKQDFSFYEFIEPQGKILTK
jgi:LPS export ABC transporter protein LptC